MTEDKLPEESIFLNALEIEDLSERSAYLDEKCGAATPLRQEVEALLAANDHSEDVLDVTADAPEKFAVGIEIGNYKLLQQIGEGGFGIVYMAEQLRPVKRKVALKVIKPGMDTNAVVARFEAERQALAMMDHPHIAKVLDGGATNEGRPFFVMELVKGVPLTTYCDDNTVSISERLRLFVNVCEAVQHAHQKGVIHRDLKPSNVMVTLHDGKPVVKVIDFGVAKAMHSELTEKTLFTAYGQMIGTPQYMSPEQAELSGLDVDTRADIYSLGVMLYELLTGSTPLDPKTLREAGFAGIQKLIKEVEAPKPSTRLSITADERVSHIADRRGISPEGLRKQLKGDVEWVIMKTLEKERGRRYATALDLAEDLERYLEGQPVLAHPPSQLYKFKKFVQQNKGPAATVAVIITSLFAALFISTRNVAKLQKSEKEQSRLRQEAERLAASNGALANREVQSRLETERLLRRSTQQRLSVQSALAAEKMPPRALLLGSEAISSALETGDQVPALAVETLQSVIANARGSTLVSLEEDLWEVKVVGDGRWLIVGGPQIHLLRLDTSGTLVEKSFVLAIDQSTSYFRCSQDGRWLSVFDEDGRLKLLDLTLDDPIAASRSWHPHSSLIDLVFSGDGRRFVTISREEGICKLWNTHNNDMSKPELVIPKKFAGPSYFGMAFSSTGSKLAVVDRSEDNNQVMISVWTLNEEEPTEVCRLPVEATYSDFPVFSPDERYLAAAGDKVWLWDLDANDIRGSSRVLLDKPVRWTLLFEPNGKRLIAADRDDTIFLLSVDDDCKNLALQKNMASVYDIAMSKSGHWLSASCLDGAIRVWDLGSEDPNSSVQVFRGHENMPTGMSYSRLEDKVYSCGTDGTVRVWNLDEDGSLESPSLLRASNWRDFGMPIHDYETGFLVGKTEGKNWKCWNLDIGDFAGESIDVPKNVNLLQPQRTGDGLWIVSAFRWTSQGSVKIVDLRPGKANVVRTLKGIESPISHVVVDPQSRFILTIGDKEVLKWDLTVDDPSLSWERVADVTVLILGHCSDITKDGTWFFAACSDGSVRR